MFDRLKNCPGCARRRARLVAFMETVKKGAEDLLPAFRSAPPAEYRLGLIEKARAVELSK